MQAHVITLKVTSGRHWVLVALITINSYLEQDAKPEDEASLQLVLHYEVIIDADCGTQDRGFIPSVSHFSDTVFVV